MTKKPITRTRQEVTNVDIDESKYVKKDDQYAYGINTFTTENDNLTAMEIVSKDKGTTANVKIPNNYWVGGLNYSNSNKINALHFVAPSKWHNQGFCSVSFEVSTYYDSASLYLNMNHPNSSNSYGLHLFLINTDTSFNKLCQIRCTDSTAIIRKGAHTITGINTYLMSTDHYDTDIYNYQHNLSISKGNEFEGLVIKFTEKPTAYDTHTTINTPELFISNIKYIKDVVGYRLVSGVVTPYVFTYVDNVLYLNGEEIDVNSLTITDEVVTL